MTTRKISTELQHYLWKGLDLKRFEVLTIVPETAEEAVIVMWDRVKASKAPWCVEYRCSGKHFESLDLLNEYCKNRWRFCVSNGGYTCC